VALSQSSVALTAEDNEIKFNQLSSGWAVIVGAQSSSSVSLTATDGSNTVSVKGDRVDGLAAFRSGTVSLESTGGDNLIELTNDGKSRLYGIRAQDDSTVELSAEDGSNSIVLNGGGSSGISSAIYASGGSRVKLAAGTDNVLTGGSFGIESIGSDVTLTASGTNTISVASTGILAEAGDSADASVKVNGQTALTAETAVSAAGSDAHTASVDINYSGESSVTGNILASDGASVSLAAADDSSTLNLTGYARTGLYSDYTDETPGTIAIDLGSGGYWSMTDSSTVTSLSGTGTVDFAGSGTSLAAETIDGEITYAMTLNTDGSGDMLYAVNGTSQTQTLSVKNLSSLLSEMTTGDAVRFATVQNAGGGFGEGTEVGSRNAGVYRWALTVDYRDAASDPLSTAAVNAAYNGGDGKPGEEAAEALYGGEGSQNIYLVMTATERPSDIVLAAEKARTVRRRLSTDIDTYVKRRGQIASFDSEKREGGWVRLLGKTADISDVSSMYRAGGEFGFSHEVESTPEHRHRVGIGLGYLRSHGSYSGVSGSWHTDGVTATLYDTAEYQKAEAAADDFWYRDSYVRFHGMHRHGSAVDPLDGTRRTQNAPASAFNVSTELGRSLPIGGGAVLIPQVQLQGSWLSSATYTDGDGVRIKEPSDWSLIGRLGFDAVKVFDAESESRGWLKASVFHEFHGEEGISARNEDAKWGEASYREADGSSDTWYTVGAGFSRKIGKAAAVFADIERTAGAGWKHAWEAHLGVRKKF
jgi:outer membrane autotransporter protein